MRLHPTLVATWHPSFLLLLQLGGLSCQYLLLPLLLSFPCFFSSTPLPSPCISQRSVAGCITTGDPLCLVRWWGAMVSPCRCRRHYSRGNATHTGSCDSQKPFPASPRAQSSQYGDCLWSVHSTQDTRRRLHLIPRFFLGKLSIQSVQLLHVMVVGIYPTGSWCARKRRWKGRRNRTRLWDRRILPSLV